MPKFQHFDVAEMLGVTPVSRISDEDVWQHLITPATKGLLGPIIRSDGPQVVETIAGAFPGDQVTNLNDHRLYGGKSDCVRFPYIRTSYKTAHGALVIKRDGVKVEAFAWSGDVEHGKGELMLKVGMRDRRFDGTPRANDSALVDYSYSDPILHKRLSTELSSVELSCYAFLPGSRVSDVTDEEFERFIENPFRFIADPKHFQELFNRAWNCKRAPGQVSASIVDVSKLIVPAFERLARARGYDLMEAAPSHYHVARWFQREGFSFSDPTQAKTFADIVAGLEKIRAAGHPLTRTQQSWTCVVQSLPAELIPAHLNMNGPLWPQTNTDDICLWMYRPLSDKAKALLAPVHAQSQQ